jgi:transglutaminase-like putative cysteine protease
MKFHIVHTTRYTYSQLVGLCHNEAHLRPRSFELQECLDAHVDIEPRPARCDERIDYFGNPVVYFSVQAPHDRLTVTATSAVQRSAPPPLMLETSLAWDRVAGHLRVAGTEATLSAREYVLDSPLVATSPDLAAFAWPSFANGRPLLSAVYDLTRRIYTAFLYDPSFTTVSTPLADVLAQRRGVCQDFAHLAIGCLRSLGLPARYVSGYLQSTPPPGQARLRGADASHAWFAVFDPDAGWVDFDPTNDQIVGDRHVTTAWGRDYADVTPLKGVVFGGGANSLEVEVEVQCDGDT